MHLFMYPTNHPPIKLHINLHVCQSLSAFLFRSPCLIHVTIHPSLHPSIKPIRLSSRNSSTHPSTPSFSLSSTRPFIQPSNTHSSFIHHLIQPSNTHSSLFHHLQNLQHFTCLPSRHTSLTLILITHSFSPIHTSSETTRELCHSPQAIHTPIGQFPIRNKFQIDCLRVKVAYRIRRRCCRSPAVWGARMCPCSRESECCL